MHSAIYIGRLTHRRLQPRPHAFSYPLFMLYLDLAELDTVFRGRWLWSASRPALARFDRRDHLGDPAQPLASAVRDLVLARSGWQPDGPIRLLTHLRYGGYGFNPVSFYYCFDKTGCRLDAVVAEVNNTPWGERHCYVLRAPPGPQQRLRARSIKALHVSPFHPMGLTYDWSFGKPGRLLDVAMRLHPNDSNPDAPRAPPVFGAALALRRHEIETRALAGVLMRFPFMTARVITAIHWQALRLWLKGVPVHDHPRHAADSSRETQT